MILRYEKTMWSIVYCPLGRCADLHTLELHEGDVLQIQFETEKGVLYTEIKASDGAVVYRGNGKETTDFTVNKP